MLFPGDAFIGVTTFVFWVVVDEAFFGKGFVERYEKNGVQVVQILFFDCKERGRWRGNHCNFMKATLSFSRVGFKLRRTFFYMYFCLDTKVPKNQDCK